MAARNQQTPTRWTATATPRNRGGTTLVHFTTPAEAIQVCCYYKLMEIIKSENNADPRRQTLLEIYRNGREDALKFKNEEYRFNLFKSCLHKLKYLKIIKTLVMERNCIFKLMIEQTALIKS